MSSRPARLVRRLEIARPIDEVFAFFADAGNLGRITPPWLHFEILSELPLDMRAGTLIDYRLRLRGVPIRWRSQITAWEPPHRFVDEQRRGPYRSWVHEHRFAPTATGTLVEDEVVYDVPGGALVNRWLVRPDLERIFDYRHEHLILIFGEPVAIT